MNVLLAEDSPYTADMTVALLQEHGHSIEVVRSVLGVRQRLKDFQPDAVLLDWMLADGASGEVINELCEAWPTTRIAVLTALPVSELPRLPPRVLVLTKPCGAEILMRVLES